MREACFRFVDAYKAAASRTHSKKISPFPVESENGNNHPKRFVLLWMGLVVLLVGAVFPGVTLLLLNWHDDPNVRWIAEIEARKVRASELCASGPRLLVAGGSSGHFSVDAELLEARLRIPTINLATHAGLGLRYLLDDVRQVARSGDIVLLYLEGQHYRTKMAGLADLERKVVWTNSPSRLFHLPLKEAFRQLYGNPFSDYAESVGRLNRRLKGEWPKAGYSFVTMGPRGDFRDTVPFRKPPEPARLDRINGPGKEQGAALQEFLKWCARRQIRVVAARPGVVRKLPEDPVTALHAYDSIRAFYEKQKVPFLETPGIFQLPAELFFDTEKHANAAGRRLITEVLVKELGRVLKQPVREENGAVFLVASRDGGTGRETIPASLEAPVVRFLSKEDLHHPLCVTPADILRLIQQKQRILFADPEVGALLGEAGIKSVPIETKSSTLEEWVKGYPNHLFVIAIVGGFDTTQLDSGARNPAGVFGLTPHRCKAAIFGTGRYSNFQRFNHSQEKPEVRLPASEKWYSRLRFPMELVAESTDLAGKEAKPIQVMRETVVNGPVPGVAAAVIDPDRGIIVKRGFFTGKTLVEWELRQVQAGAL